MTNYYNLKLTALLEAKFDKGLLRKFYENTELLQYSFLKKLFELLMEINQSNDIINDIGQKYKSNDNRNIISDDLEKKLNESEELLHIYNNIINYLENIPYVDNSNDLDETFMEQYDSHISMLNDTENYEEREDEIDSGIVFFEELKNNFRGKNQKAFEFYDGLQEKYYQILELNFGIKYDNIKDNWN